MKFWLCYLRSNANLPFKKNFNINNCFGNPPDEQISKLPLILSFDEELTEIFKVEDKSKLFT